MTLTVTDRSVILELLQTKPRDMIIGDFCADEVKVPFEKVIDKNGLVLQGNCKEVETLFLPLLMLISLRVHFVLVIELGMDLPVDTIDIDMLFRAKAYAEHSLLLTRQGSDIRMSLAFYNKRFGRIYDIDLFPNLLFS